MKANQLRILVGGVSALALSTALAQAQTAADNAIAALDANGAYLSGDKHNHTTCTDGAMSVQTVTNESIVTYGLDWYAYTGHGGEGPRDCRFDDPEYDGAVSGSGRFWTTTVGPAGIEGDGEFTTGNGAGTFFGEEGGQEMWRWQQVEDYAYALNAQMGRINDEPTWTGMETNAPGHEHVSMSVLNEQLFNPIQGNASAVAQFEYLFDRSDDDRAGGRGYEDPANNGIPKIPEEEQSGIAGHASAVRSVEWLAENYLTTSYYVPAHVERQGGFVSDGTAGWNVEHFRDLHTAGLLFPNPQGPSLVFGAEMLAGHQFGNGGRGTYEMDRPTAGFGTYGGAGAYSGAEIAVPGFDFDGTELTNARLNEIRAEFDALFEGQRTEPSGSDAFDQLDACSDCSDPAPEIDGVGTSPRERFVLGRPGVQTMWDALLGEGRRFYNFGSSDWHNRGAFGPFEPQSTLDPWPGEYNKIYAYVEGGDEAGFTQNDALKIVGGMRRGNTFSVMGDLIDYFSFAICQGETCAVMGSRLTVDPNGEDLVWTIRLRDPEGANFSPYTFDNMSLAQLGLSIPTNEPMLSHIDIIRGDVTGIIAPEDPAYTTNVSNPSTEIFARVDNMAGEFEADGAFLVARGTIDISTVTNDFYIRVRGTNMPVGTPNETNEDGNPLLDDYSLLIPCTAVDPEPDGTFKAEFCPEHLPVDADGTKYLDADVEAWTDLWFYANPIFVRLAD